MRITLTVCTLSAVLSFASQSADATLLTNGNLDLTQEVEIVPGFFLPKPAGWQNEGSRLISGPYEDEMSSEPWAGPDPTPVTTDGNFNPPHPEGCGGPDCGVFFHPFSGNAVDGPATGHLYQDVPATPGLLYVLTGWAGAEANFLGDAHFALDFLDSGGNEIGSAVLDLLAAGLFVNNGEPFNYKQFTVSATAPVNTAFTRARISMLNGLSNPLGGGQAFVVDDFELTAIPEPSTLSLALLGAAAIIRRRR